MASLAFPYLVLIIATALSSLVSLSSTLIVIFLQHMNHHGLAGEPGVSGGVEQSSSSCSSKSKVKASALTASSDTSHAHKAQPLDCLATVDASLDLLSQALFLSIVLTALIKLNNSNNGVSLLDDGFTLFTCALVLSLRLVVPLVKTVLAATPTAKIKERSTRTVYALFAPPALIISFLVATAALGANMLHSRTSVGILLLCVIGVCISVHTFIATRLVLIKERSKAKGHLRARSHSRQAKDGSPSAGQLKTPAFLASTISTAGTKASSANPYETALRRSLIAPYHQDSKCAYSSSASLVAAGYVPPDEEAVRESSESDLSLHRSQNPCTVWSNQSLPFPRDGNDLGPTNSILHPASLSLESQEVSYAPQHDNADHVGARLRVYSSARDLMTPFSLDTLEGAANDLALQPILLALVTVWLTSLLCLPLLVTITVPAYQTSRMQLPFTLCFILAMSISGPILLFQVLQMRRARAGAGGHNSSSGMIPLDEVFPRPSFASSLLIGRTSNVSSALSTSEGMPIAGNGFEPVNGYDTPVLFCQAGSYRKKMIKSVAYQSEHWSAGRIDGDQIASSQGIFRRARNMLSPKPKLQVLSPQVVTQRGRVRHMPGHMSVEDRFDEGDDDEYDRSSSQVGFLQDISEPSVVLPEALPISATAGLMQDTSLNMQGSRRIDTIYEADTPCASESAFSLRKRRPASVASISTIETNGSCTDPGQSRRDGAAMAAKSFTSAAHHRTSFSMSVISEVKDGWPSRMSERRWSPDATVSDVELADISNLSCREGYENDSAEKSSSVKKAGAVQLQDVKQDSPSRNWLRIEHSSQQGSESAADGDISVSSTTRSLAGGMGIYLLDQEEPVASVLVTQSTPPARSSHDSLSAAQETIQKRKSLSCEMGLPSKTACDSPSHSLSDVSSVQAKRSTLDTITESLLSGSSVYEEDERQSPNGTLERARRTQAAIEREIVVIEMDESQNSQQQIGSCEVGTHSPLASQLDAQADPGVKEEFTFTTHHFYQQQGNWLDPVEEVTEEPTLPMSGRDTPTKSDWSCTSRTNSSSQSSTHRRNRSLVRSKMPSDEWVRLHGFATPSSIAQSPASQSRFGWAEVIETGRVAARVSLQRQYSRSPRSSSRSYHGRGGNSSISTMDVNLSPHARAYLATRCGTPSRLIGLQSSFWLTSPPRFALHARALQEEVRSEKMKLRKAVAPSSGAPLLDHDESSWVDGALDDEDEEEAKQQMQRAEKKWKRKSRSMQGLEGMTVTSPLVSAVSMTSQAKSKTKATNRSSKRSSASLQSIFDAAMRRGSGILLPTSKKRESSNSSSNGGSVSGSGSGSQSVRTSVASVTAMSPAKVKRGEGLGRLGASHSRSVIRASPPSTPRKQCSPSKARLDHTVTITRSSQKSRPQKASADFEQRSVVSIGNMPETPPSHGSRRELDLSARRRSTRSMRTVKSGDADADADVSSYGSPLKPASRRAIIAEHRVPSRKDTKVRETVKMLENAVRAAMEQQQYASLHDYPHDEVRASPLRVTTSPTRSKKRKVMHPREVVRGSPGKFRLIQDLDPDCVENSPSPQVEKARAYPRGGPSFYARRRSSAACPQIIVRPPSGSSTHTHRLQ